MTVVRQGDGLIFHRGLMSFVDRIEYDWSERYGQVWCRGPVAMSGTIRFFTGIDDGCVLICAYLHGKPDGVYRKRNDKWEFGDLRNRARPVLSLVPKPGYP